MGAKQGRAASAGGVLAPLSALLVILDTSVLTALIFVGPIDERRFVDVSENALYWYFVVFTWLPIYAVIYWAPRGL